MKTQGRFGRFALALVAVACIAGSAPHAQQLAMEPLKDSGSNVYPAFEGWYQNDDGSFTLLIGYYNRNKKEVLDIPIGPENKIEPGGPDQGQPTHFEVGRGWGTIAIKVPKDFRRQEADLDAHREWQDRVGAVRRRQGLPDRAVPRRGDG